MAQFIPFIAQAVIGAAVSGIAGKIFGQKTPKGGGVDPAVAQAQARQQALLDQQEASQKRLQNQTNQQTAELDKKLAGQQAAVLRRRKGNGGTSYAGPNTGLKNTLGG